MPTLRHRGIQQFYALEGTGPEMVWCHGLYLDSRSDRTFWGLPHLLARNYRLLTFDARGHGRTTCTGTDTEFAWAELAADLEGLMAHVDMSRAILAGGSMGGITALTLALEHPEKALCLFLYQPSAVGRDVRRIHRIGRAIDGLLAHHGMAGVTGLLMAANPVLSSDGASQERLDALRQAMMRQRLEAMRAATRAVTGLPGLDASWLQRLEALDIPVLLVAEPDDPIHPRTSAEQLHAVLPRSRLIVAPDNFHFFLHPEELVRHLEAFMQALP